ncbi:Ig-like domain-containing protein [Planctellipticum variicoloris]|uniref:Ig-like domain-containing protein n=1 Tax=Planctellipticum variicoloris TaxID=3064265 RepID=UPI00301348A0|nr:Ig-like domain-containing protein [Planctomycetaceae bacterium SH412]
MKRVAILLVALSGSLVPGVAPAEDVTLESVPPVVVKTVPEAGAGDIDPQLTEIKITFSKEMQDGSWSWSTLSKESFPELNGKPKYLDDKRTCVLPVKLEPGKTYAIWANSQKFRNFKDAGGRPAVPYLLVFKTGKSEGASAGGGPGK